MAVTIDPKSKKLIIRFRVAGYAKQFYLSTGLKDNKSNRAIVETRWELIQREISLGEFDPSLERYRFGDKKVVKTKTKELNIKKCNLLELWQKFTEFKSHQIEQTTILSTYAAIERYIKRLPTQSLEDAGKIRDWLLTNTTQYMASRCLTNFNLCCQWAVESELISSNPFSKLKIQKPKKSSRDDDDHRAFTQAQREIIIDAFEHHRLHSHYTPLIKFLFWTGARPGEAFALTWGDVSDNARKISITKSRNLHGILKGTKNGKKRIFPVAAESKLQKLLLEIRPDKFSPNDLIFRSKTGRRLSSDILNNVWNDSTTYYKGERWNYPGVVTELVHKGRLPFYLKPYSTRHTFATWAIASGITPDKVALWIGDEVGTVLKHYCHPNVVEADCPDF